MRIAFVTHYDAEDRRAWSGTFFSMLRALQRHCGEVVSVGPAGRPYYLAGKVCRGAWRLMSGQNIDYNRTVTISKALGRIFQRRLEHANVDVVFAPSGSVEIAFLRSTKPIVWFGDVTERIFRDYAANLEGLSPWSLRQCDLIERRAMANASRLVYASTWAAHSAKADYGLPDEKVRIVPMGANLDEAPPAEEVLAARESPFPMSCRLLFVGVDWDRKGGPIALKAMRELRDRGIDATLTVLGCVPPEEETGAGVAVVPFLDKRDPQQRAALDELLLKSDFMLFPSRREAYGIVCCEAAAFGLPVIAADAGGVPVWTGQNGVLLDLAAGGSAYADAVHSLLQNPQQYLDLARSSRQLFESRLNWDSWARSMLDIFRELSPIDARTAEPPPEAVGVE